MAETGPVVEGDQQGLVANAAIGINFMPDLQETVDQAVASQAKVMPLVEEYQQQAAQFISEHGADVVGGHSPVSPVTAAQFGQGEAPYANDPGNPEA